MNPMLMIVMVAGVVFLVLDHIHGNKILYNIISQMLGSDTVAR